MIARPLQMAAGARSGMVCISMRLWLAILAALHWAFGFTEAFMETVELRFQKDRRSLYFYFLMF